MGISDLNFSLTILTPPQEKLQSGVTVVFLTLSWLHSRVIVLGPRSMVQGNRAILLAENHTLDPWPLDEGPRTKSGKSWLNLHATILEGTWVLNRLVCK